MKTSQLNLIIFLFFSSLGAHAQYIDPGSGSHLLQLLLGGILVLVFYYKVIVYKVRSFIAFLFKSKKDKNAN